MRPPAFRVPCVLCGEPHGFDVLPGEREITSGPSDHWYPGSPPEIDWRSEGCECHAHSVVDELRYWDAMNEAAWDSVQYTDVGPDPDEAYEAARDR